MTIAQTLEKLLPRHKYLVDMKGGSLLKSSIPYYWFSVICLYGYWAMEDYSITYVLINYTLFPLIDQMLTLDFRNPDKQQAKELQKNGFFFELPLYLIIVLDMMLFIKALNYYSMYEFSIFTLLNLIGVLFMMMNICAVIFVISHEMYHKPGKFSKYFGALLLAKMLYLHWNYGHVYDHHKNVSTPLDKSSAQKDIDVYSFAYRSFKGTYQSVYKLQKQAGIPIYRNLAVLSVVQGFLLTLLIGKIWGFQSMIMYLITVAGSLFFVQATNYIEHYGLSRSKLADGTYQKVTIKHSWNAAHRITNWSLFKLQRHSDHHQNPLKPYQILQSLEDSPQLPAGYGLTLLMSFYPQVWFKVMNPVVDAYNKVKSKAVDPAIIQSSAKTMRVFLIEASIRNIIIFLLNEVLMFIGRSI